MFSNYDNLQNLQSLVIGYKIIINTHDVCYFAMQGFKPDHIWMNALDCNINLPPNDNVRSLHHFFRNITIYGVVDEQIINKIKDFFKNVADYIQNIPTDYNALQPFHFSSSCECHVWITPLFKNDNTGTIHISL